MSIETINLSNEFSSKLGFKVTAKKIFNELNGVDEAILDFENIEFISCSFAQEYVYQRYHSNIEITEINMSDFVKGLIDVVEEDFKETCL